MSETLKMSDMMHADQASARRALENVGGVVVPELSLTVSHPVVGTVRREFAYLGNLVANRSYLPDDTLLRRLSTMLDSPDNERVLRKLEADKIQFMPLNKRTVRKLVDSLHDARVHLPWAFRPMNFDFGARLEERSESQPFRFKVFYSQGVDFSADGTEATVKRVFSLPVQGSAHGTFQEPIFDEMLDEDVGMFMEANWVS